MDIGTRIKMRRMALGLRQKELARRAEMNAAQLCQIENGRVSPSFGIVERIAAALDTDISGLYAGISADEPMNPVAEVVDSDYMPIRSHEPDAAVAIEALGGVLSFRSVRFRSTSFRSLFRVVEWCLPRNCARRLVLALLRSAIWSQPCVSVECG